MKVKAIEGRRLQTSDDAWHNLPTAANELLVLFHANEKGTLADVKTGDVVRLVSRRQPNNGETRVEEIHVSRKKDAPVPQPAPLHERALTRMPGDPIAGKPDQTKDI